MSRNRERACNDRTTRAGWRLRRAGALAGLLALALPLAAAAHSAPGSRRVQLAAVLTEGDGLLVDKPRSESPQPWVDFETELRAREEAGQRVHDLEVVILKEMAMFTAVWRPGEGHVHIEPVLTAHQLDDSRRHLSAAGYRLTDLEAYTVNGQHLYAGVWSEGSGAEEVRLGLDREAFEAERRELSNQGLMLVDFETSRRAGKLLYHGLWRPGDAPVEILVLESRWPVFEALIDNLGDGNLRLGDLEIYEVEGKTVYSGVWHPGREAYWSWIGFRERCLNRKVAWLAREQTGKAAQTEPRCRPGEDTTHGTLPAGEVTVPEVVVAVDRAPTDREPEAGSGTAEVSGRGFASGRLDPGEVASELAPSSDRGLGSLDELDPPDPAHAELPPLAIEDFELTGLLPMPEEEGAKVHTHLPAPVKAGGVKAGTHLAVALGEQGLVHHDTQAPDTVPPIVYFHLGVAHDGGSSGPDI